MDLGIEYIISLFVLGEHFHDFLSEVKKIMYSSSLGGHLRNCPHIALVTSAS
jgi:hypothetical protein